MTPYAQRRNKAVFWLALSALAVLAVHHYLTVLLGRIIFLTGWVLLLFMLILTAYNPRKKLPFIPLKSSESWLQFHIYAGVFAVLLFLLHINFKGPTGWFDWILATLYALVTLSGIFGLAISRTLPKRLTARGGEVLFERIPIVRRELRERAEALALHSIPEGQTATIADFYVRDLLEFFRGPRNIWHHLSDDRTPLNRLMNKVTDINRYLNEQERLVMAQIAELVRQKDGLDYQYTLQMVLKLWLFVHIPLTYGLLLWSAMHVVLVYAFSGGAG